MKTAVIFCDHISERKLSKYIQKFYDLKTKFNFLKYPTCFCKGMMNIEILENFGDRDDHPFEWCIDISSVDKNKERFKQEVEVLNKYLASKCKTSVDWEDNLKLD